jgi:hypothetical protein
VRRLRPYYPKIALPDNLPILDRHPGKVNICAAIFLFSIRVNAGFRLL